MSGGKAKSLTQKSEQRSLSHSACGNENGVDDTHRR